MPKTNLKGSVLFSPVYGPLKVLYQVNWSPHLWRVELILTNARISIDAKTLHTMKIYDHADYSFEEVINVTE